MRANLITAKSTLRQPRSKSEAKEHAEPPETPVSVSTSLFKSQNEISAFEGLLISLSSRAVELQGFALQVVDGTKAFWPVSDRL